MTVRLTGDRSNVKQEKRQNKDAPVYIWKGMMLDDGEENMHWCA